LFDDMTIGEIVVGIIMFPFWLLVTIIVLGFIVYYSRIENKRLKQIKEENAKRKVESTDENRY